MEPLGEDRLHVVADGGEHRRSQPARTHGFRRDGRTDGIHGAGTGCRRQRILADPHTQDLALRRRIQSRLPLQHPHLAGSICPAHGRSACHGTLLRLAGDRSRSTRTLSAAAAKRLMRHTEYDHGTRVPLCAALDHNLPLVAHKRYRSHRHGSGRLRRLEPRGTARGDDGSQGGNAVVAQSVASARCACRISARDGSIQSAPHVDRSGHIALQQCGAALHRQDIFGRRPRIL